MGEPISRDIAELREWLVRIDTKMDYMSEVKRVADEADAKADKALAMSEDNREDIRDMKANTKWVWGTMIAVLGLLATVGVAVFG
ncbi:holin [Bacillus sp. AFS073361]|uniref:hemolysin XhlA family protein n=1 Tax=Bacillus sp. AFS073361 TaxID=2033511 RepID=UPI000BF58E82|nr:hemolysin XhlA family protein [Bacillus sp. AFS073361]PFP30273.1 holin [Bacillus sp. AFS073361]